MHKIVGLDLGTNSIGWAVVDPEEKRIEDEGSRVIPMSSDMLGDFEKGNTVSQTQDRTAKRGMRRLLERRLLRRERLLRVLKIMDFLPPHYAAQLSRYGKFAAGAEPKLAWREGEDGKMEFLFQSSFQEMMAAFRAAQPQWLGEGHKVPYDWTIYYLRHKALTQPLTKEELAWVLLQFNQKRGYNKLRGEDEEETYPTKREEYAELKIIAVEDSGDRKGKDIWYNVQLENGLVYRRTSRVPIADWVGQTMKFVITTALNPDGTVKKDKDGKEKISIRAPKEDDWGLQKLRTEHLLTESHTTVGDYIYRNLLLHPDQKVIGQLVRVVDRKYYKEELTAILSKQKDFLPKLTDAALYAQCIEELYPTNDAYRKSIAHRDFTYLLHGDILFYQRPLKSKKSLIDNCPYEERYYTDKEGKRQRVPVKCASKSHPLFQEFRLWQFISNLRLYRRQDDSDVTIDYLPDNEARVELFDQLRQLEKIDQKTLLTLSPIKRKKKEVADYRWNYVEDKFYPCCSTHALMEKGMAKLALPSLTEADELLLWEILYSVSDAKETEQALRTFAAKRQLPQEDFAQQFHNSVLPETGYAAYSLKAIRHLLPLMRVGSYWSADAIDAPTRERIDHLIHHTPDDGISPRVRALFDSRTIAEAAAEARAHPAATAKTTYAITSLSQCQGLSTWAACYLVYNRHSEAKEVTKWEKPEDIDDFLLHFPQHSMRNPVVEQVALETLRVVRDIWRRTGRIDEIHVEMGRDMKRTKEERERYSEMNAKNETTNQRIRLLLTEFLNPDFKIENVRPQSPTQMEIFKLYEEGAGAEMEDEISDIQKRITSTDPAKRPTHAELIRYKCWLDQRYLSPYTGRPIPLGKLFTEAYEIEHIIPQSRYFDDSLSNKVICESEVNKLKDRQLAHEFIASHHGEKVQLSLGGAVEILSVEAYEELVQRCFAQQRARKRKLLLDDIPDGFNERQMNDSRYISRYISTMLSNVVRTRDEAGHLEQETVVKNLILCNGTITDRLKHDWGLDDVWNRIVLPRFERLNSMSGTTHYTALTATGHTIPDLPLELRTGFSKKRIDHRHHAMDAIVIACTTRDHVNLLNNETAKAENDANRYALQHKLRTFTTYQGSDGKMHPKAAAFKKPWDTFSQDAYDALQGIIVSFKQNQRVINKSSNRYSHFEPLPDGTKAKKERHQMDGQNWAIRKSMHKETVFGEVNLQTKDKKEITLRNALKQVEHIADPELKAHVKGLKNEGMDDKQILCYFGKHAEEWSEIHAGKVEVYCYKNETKYATRCKGDLLTFFAGCKDAKSAEKAIAAITDTGIQKILLRHLSAEAGDPMVAFSAEGIVRMNANLKSLNDGHRHQPIYKVRHCEASEAKFPIGTLGNKRAKFVEADKGTNLYFLIYRTEGSAERAYTSLPLRFVIECQKRFGKPWRKQVVPMLCEQKLLPENATMLFLLSPNDLVYVPSEQERQEGVKHIDSARVYKMVSCNKKQCFFIPHRVAKVIVDKVEFNVANKIENFPTGVSIKSICLPLTVDRLGQITALESE